MSPEDPAGTAARPHRLVAVLPLWDQCVFPEASLTTLVTTTGALKGLDLAARLDATLLAVQTKDRARDLQTIGTLVRLRSQQQLDDGTRRIELDGVERAELVSLWGLEATVAEIAPLPEGDEGDEWGPAVEALARYLHAHSDLRTFLEGQRRSSQVMAWVNLACQHLPIAASARQKLLEAAAAERCRRIARGLDALLRKEKGD